MKGSRVPVTIPFYAWTLIEEILEKNRYRGGEGFDEVMFYVFDDWARLRAWLDREKESGGGELSDVWESILDYERERRLDVEDALAEPFYIDPSYLDKGHDFEEEGLGPW